MVPLALIAVMVRVQHPLDLADSGLPEVLEDAARTEVDQEPAVTPDQEVDVAGVAVPVEARRQANERAGSARAMGVGMSVAAMAMAVAGIVVRVHAGPPVAKGVASRRRSSARHHAGGSPSDRVQHTRMGTTRARGDRARDE
jgi:hypothetical protein